MNSDITFASDAGSTFGWVALPVLLLIQYPWVLLFIAWFIPGCLLVLRETAMDRPNRVPMFYGYTVCLIALVLGLMSVSALIDAGFERANPLQDKFGYGGQSLTSFEAFEATRQAMPNFGRETAAPPDTASLETRRARFDAIVADRISSSTYQTSKTFVTQGLFLVIAIGLFVFHWRWMKRLHGASAGDVTAT